VNKKLIERLRKLISEDKTRPKLWTIGAGILFSDDISEKIRKSQNKFEVQKFVENNDEAIYWLGQAIKYRMEKIKQDHCE